MKHLSILLTLTSLLLAACGGAPTPDIEATVQAAIAATEAAPNIEATVQAAIAATQAAQPTEMAAPQPTKSDVPTVAPGETPSATMGVPTATPGDTPTSPVDTPSPPPSGGRVESLCPDPQPPLVTDFEVRQTPDLPEPPARVPFRDPVFGTCLVRVTDRKVDLSPDDPSAGLKNEYSRVQSFNADGSWVLVRSIEANWYLYDAHTLQPLGQLPLEVEPRWDASEPYLLYYSDETRLMAYDVRNGEQHIVHDFASDFPDQFLTAVWTRYEGSPSLDGRYWGLMAQDQDWQTVVLLVYDRVEDRVMATRDLRELSETEREIDSVTISPLGNYFLAYHEYCEPGQPGDEAHPCGLMVYDRDLTNGRSLLRIIGHSDLALDAEGREVLIYQDIDTDHISMLDLASGTVTPLWPIDFSHTPIGLHFSGRAFRRPGWALVSTYSGGHPTDYTWMDDQVFALELKPDGRVVRLAHTHSLVDENQEHDYWAEPHVSVNPDFTRIVFTSNWGRSGTGEVEMLMIELPPDWPTRLSLAPAATPTPSDVGASVQPSGGATYYVRPDGGSTDQCTGLVDAPYPGSGTGQSCAWDHPFRALPPLGSALITGGDTLIIASGSYMMGYGAPGADACESDGAFECHAPPVPSGPGPSDPTRILGAGWDAGCSNPPELWGTERPWFILNLTDSNNVEVACLEITDHSDCVEDHTGGLACERDNPPYGEWAAVGIYAEDSANVHLRNLNIHGLAVGGIHAGRLTDWTVENVRIAGNGWAGWDGDIEGDDSNSGTLTFRHWTVEWNGCGETYPGGQPTGCWGQSAGGYGDGVGTGTTGGHWIVEDSTFRYNTSDGLDLLYAREEGSLIEIRRTVAEGNAGNQVKTSGPMAIENVLAVSNCGFFEGKPFTHNVDYCRAGGNAIALTLRTDNQATVVNSTVTGHGDCLLIAECQEGYACGGSASVLLRNDIFQGNPEFQGGGDTTCLTWTDIEPDPIAIDHAIINRVKNPPDPCPPDSQCGVSPGLANESIDAFDGHLLETSPAIDQGTAVGAPSNDVEGRPRGDQPDIGAYER